MRANSLSRTLAQLPGLPFATVMALLLVTLCVSILSSYDAEARWLRFGSVLLAVGLAMWLPALWAAALAAGISLASGLLRGGTGDLGILRPETLFEMVGLAATAILTAWLREQIACLLEGSSQPDVTGAVALSEVSTRPVRGMPIPVATSPQRSENRSEPANPARPQHQEPGLQADAATSLLAFHQDESLASYTTYLACLRLELAKTASIIQEVRSCSMGIEDYGPEYDETLRIADAEDYEPAPVRMERLPLYAN